MNFKLKSISKLLLIFLPAPDDYNSTEEMITFLFSPQIVSIPIVFDAIEEMNETFTVRLIPAPDQNLEGIIISPDVATVTIIGKFNILVKPQK